MKNTNNMKLQLSFLCSLMFLYACKSQVHKEESSNNPIIKEIPLSKKGTPYPYYKNKPLAEKDFGLATLEKGFDSIQFRLWYSYASTDSGQLVILKYNQNRWSGELINFVYNYNSAGDSIISFSKTSQIATPKNGWESLGDNILKSGIDTLSDEHKVVNYPSLMDGDNVLVEVATKDKYRIYTYQEPFRAQDKFIQAKILEDFMILIEQELGFIRKRKF